MRRLAAANLNRQVETVLQFGRWFRRAVSLAEEAEPSRPALDARTQAERQSFRLDEDVGRMMEGRMIFRSSGFIRDCAAHPSSVLARHLRIFAFRADRMETRCSKVRSRSIKNG